jgi:uncharacterized protein (DUF2249 family)
MKIKYRKLNVKPILKKGEHPFPAIQNALQSLAKGEGLELIAPFLPSPLIEKMDSEGYAYRVEHQPKGDWIVWFWRK